LVPGDTGRCVDRTKVGTASVRAVVAAVDGAIQRGDSARIQGTVQLAKTIFGTRNSPC
jgi:hypothetical protein